MSGMPPAESRVQTQQVQLFVWVLCMPHSTRTAAPSCGRARHAVRMAQQHAQSTPVAAQLLGHQAVGSPAATAQSLCCSHCCCLLAPVGRPPTRQRPVYPPTGPLSHLRGLERIVCEQTRNRGWSAKSVPEWALQHPCSPVEQPYLVGSGLR